MRIIRYEFKYFITEVEYKQVMDCISHYLVPDPYAAQKPGYRYIVNSLYLDSPSRLYYDEKMAGMKIRKKVRMRCYDEDFYNAGVYFAEIKGRDENHIDKLRVKMPADDFHQFMGQDFYNCPPEYLGNGSEESDIMSQLLYFTNAHVLSPEVFICYEREAYIAENDDSVRVTFDRYVTSERFVSRFGPVRVNQASIFPGRIILELKVKTLLPFWLHNMVKQFGMHYESISKYCGGVESVDLLYQ